MYKKLEQRCSKCRQRMLEVLGYTERIEGEHPQVYRKGWFCPWCKNWEEAILREKYVEEER
jgi:uncharacterized protein with PIN domain